MVAQAKQAAQAAIEKLESGQGSEAVDELYRALLAAKEVAAAQSKYRNRTIELKGACA